MFTKIANSRRRSTKLLRLASFVSLLFIAAVAQSCMFTNPYLDQEVSGPVTLSQQWLELNPKEPMKVERDTQEVTMIHDMPVEFRDGGKLFRADGLPLNIEVELIDSKGVTHHPRPGISRTTTGDNLKYLNFDFENLPTDVTYKTVRIKSNNSFPVNKVIWRCYNWSEARK